MTSDGQQLSKCTYMYCHPLTLPLIEWDAFIQMIVMWAKVSFRLSPLRPYEYTCATFLAMSPMARCRENAQL